MKIFLCDFSSPQLKSAALKLKDEGVEILYWTGSKHVFEETSRDLNTFPNVVFHNQFDAVRAIPAPNIDISKFKVPSIELIQELLECESLVLTMMTRMDFGNMPLIKKKHLYYKYVQYWNGILDSMKPDAILFGDVPHIVYNLVLYYVAKKYQIPTIMLEVTCQQDKWMVVRDFKKASLNLLAAYNEIKNENHTTGELMPESRNYFERLINPNLDATPAYKQQLDIQTKKPLKVAPQLSSIVKNIFSGSLPKTSYWYIKTLLFNKRGVLNIDENDNVYYKNVFQRKKMVKIKKEFKKEYVDLQSTADFNKKFIYFPLQLQPESSTSPLAGFYVDLILIIKTISSSIPDDWLIYVKEYGAQWNPHNSIVHLCRYKNYYKEMKKLKNVRLISPNVSTYDLIAHSQAVATATGTAGWEALAANKPVVLFGYPWYMYCDGVFRVNSCQECEEAVKKIIEGRKPDRQKVLNYFLAWEKICVRGAPNNFSQKFSDINSAEAANNIFLAFLKELKSLNKYDQP